MIAMLLMLALMQLILSIFVCTLIVHSLAGELATANLPQVFQFAAFLRRHSAEHVALSVLLRSV